MSDQWRSCPRCGVKLIAAAKFCHACGTAVNHEEQTQPESLQRKPEEEKISFGRWLEEELAETPETPTKKSETPLETRSKTEEIKEEPWKQPNEERWKEREATRQEDHESNRWAYVGLGLGIASFLLGGLLGLIPILGAVVNAMGLALRMKNQGLFITGLLLSIIGFINYLIGWDYLDL